MSNVPTRAFALPSPTTCTECNAVKFAYECPTFCCQNGKVKLSSNEIPQPLIDLFTKDDERGEDFRKYARLYNNFFAFTSLGGKFKKQNKNGIYTLTLHGQVYHFIPDLLPDSENPNYLQMYFYDGAAEIDIRTHRYKQLCPNTIAILMSLMDLNPYAYFFQIGRASCRERV